MHGAPQQPQQGGGLLATSCLAVSITGLLPESIQQKGVVGSLVSSLGGALKGSPGGWNSSGERGTPLESCFQMTIGQEDAKKATCTTAPDRELEAADQRRA